MERQATRLRAQRPLPGAPLGPVCTVSLRTAVASNFPAYRRWRSFETSCDPTDRPAGRNPTGNLFALLKLQCRHSSATRRRSDPSIESHDPLDAGLVPPFQRPGDGNTFVRSSSAPQSSSLLLRRETISVKRHHLPPPYPARLEKVLRRSVEITDPTRTSACTLPTRFRTIQVCPKDRLTFPPAGS